MTKVFVGIGSNIDRKKNLRFCLEQLKTEFGKIVCSKIYQNSAVGFKSDDFYNLVAQFWCDLTVFELIDVLKKIEIGTGRNKTQQKFSSRTLDIDILLFGNENYQPDLDIPRKEITKYNFVLQPLVEIADGFIHPVSNTSINTILQNFNGEKLTKTVLL